MIENILKKARENGFSAKDLELITLAYKELDGMGDHGFRVGKIVCDLNSDITTILAALLHDAVISEKLSLEDVNEKYGSDVSLLISNLIKIENIKMTDFNESTSLYLRKVLVGISDDVRVIIIKLADRLDEMRNAIDLTSEEKKALANDTMNVLVPIAHRLGINSIKSELEDLSLKFSKPDVYNEILEKLDGTRADLMVSLEDMKNSIMDILSEHGISFSIKARVKSVYSIYNKLTTGRKWSDIYDILAMRLIVPTKEDCYTCIGLIHAKYRPIPKRFKDYIAMPKENMYQSLHTSVFGIDGHIFEIQIRTPEMDELAEHGVASHWSYKEHGTLNSQNMMEQKLAIFRNIINLAKEESTEEMFNQNMEQELFNNLIYVYTPKGDVIEMPAHATPIDFAYRIHSDVGDKTVSAIVNDNIVPLNYELQDGDVIKINTNNSSKPSKSWLKFVKTPQARNKIKSYFSKRDKEKYILEGKDLLEKELKKEHLNFNDLYTTEKLKEIYELLKINSVEDIYLGIGSLRFTASYIVSLGTEKRTGAKEIIIEKVSKPSVNNKISYKNDVIVAGTDNILINIAKCCTPVYGDEIIGYVTKGEGVSVHRKSCPNIKGVHERLIDVSWNASAESKLYLTDIVIKTDTDVNHLLDIVTVASTRNVSVNSVKEINNDDKISYKLMVKTYNTQDLERFLDDIRLLRFVLEVVR
jgi:GTP diphosphokinase / guanosine-3',5'-bis(diphosphate) 3'-diphosphatase